MGKAPLVAIVEDDRALVVMLQKVLTWYDIPVAYVAYNGREAIDKFCNCKKKPGIILMDSRMPLLDGISATRRILAVSPNAKIIFLSAEVGQEKEALEAGAAAFLKKPTGIHAIIDAITNLS